MHRLPAAAHSHNVTGAPTTTSRAVAPTRTEADTLVDLLILVPGRQNTLTACERRNGRIDTRRWQCQRPRTIVLRATRRLARLTFAALQHLLQGCLKAVRIRKRGMATTPMDSVRPYNFFGLAQFWTTWGLDTQCKRWIAPATTGACSLIAWAYRTRHYKPLGQETSPASLPLMKWIRPSLRELLGGCREDVRGWKDGSSRTGGPASNVHRAFDLVSL